MYKTLIKKSQVVICEKCVFSIKYKAAIKPKKVLQW